MHSIIKNCIVVASAIVMTITSISCSIRNEGDIPNSAGGDGKGDATNTLRYQNRTVK